MKGNTAVLSQKSAVSGSCLNGREPARHLGQSSVTEPACQAVPVRGNASTVSSEASPSTADCVVAKIHF